MLAIIRQARANLRSRRLQSALILLTLFAAATLLTVALGALYVARGSYDRLFERTHGAHLWLYLDPQRVTVEEIEALLADLPGVEATTGVIRSYVLLTAEQRSEERVDIQKLREWPGAAVAVNRPLLMAGRAPQEGESEAVLLDRNVAAMYDVAVGDTIDMPVPGGLQSLTVVGLFVSAELCPYYICPPAPSYLAPGGMSDLELLPSPVPGVESLDVGLRLRNPAEVEQVQQAIEAALPAGAITGWHAWEFIRDMSNYASLPERVLFTTFSIVAGLASGFLVANGVAEAVRNQTRQIGLLKAVGFTGWQLALVYLAEYLGLALVASLAGLAAGSLLSPAILSSVTARFGEMLIRPPLWIALVPPLSTLLITIIFTLWPVRRAARLDVVTAIRVGAERPRRRARRARAVAAFRRLPFLAIGVHDALSRPLRSTLTALALGMAVLTLTGALTYNATLRALAADPGLGIVPDGDLFLSRSVYLEDAEVRQIIAEQPDVVAYYAEMWWEFDLPAGEEMRFSHYAARFREGDLEAFEFPILEGRMCAQPDEVVVGYSLAREKNLHPGDNLTILLEGEPLTLPVVGVYRETSFLGHMLILPVETLYSVQPDASPFSYMLNLRPGADAQAVATALQESSNGLLEVAVTSEQDMPPELTSLQGVMAALSLVLGGIAVVGVFNSVWMGVWERRREFGLLKAVGMTPGQVSLSVLTGAAIMALVGYAVGLPAGVGLLRLLLDGVARGIGWGPISPPVDVLGLALLLPGIVLVAVVAAFLPARRAGRVSVVEMLRHE